ncbi:UNVERIFIED_CONTAM: hypothetical protein Sradi_7255100 [Sesamum radiatum]
MDPVLFFDSPLSMETNLVLFAGWEDLVFSFKAWVLILEREDKLSVRTSNCHGSLYLTILYVKPTSGRLPSSGFLSLELEHYPSPYLVPRTFPGNPPSLSKSLSTISGMSSYFLLLGFFSMAHPNDLTFSLPDSSPKIGKQQLPSRNWSFTRCPSAPTLGK